MAGSEAEKAKPAAVEVVVAAGPEVMVVCGGVASTVVVVVVRITSCGRCDLILASRDEKTVSSADDVARSKA